MEDLCVMDIVCEFLNYKYCMNKVLGWWYFGINLEIDKEILDDFLFLEEDFVFLIEVMINYFSCWKLWLIIVEFIFVLYVIVRDDVFIVFDGYFLGRKL